MGLGLCPHDSAPHAPRCHHYTRNTTIGDIVSWIGDPSRTSGVKTAIVQSLCKRSVAAQWLTGSFFSRYVPGRCNAEFLFPHIFQPTLANPNVGKSSMKSSPMTTSIAAKALEIQLQKLILEPLKQGFKATDRCCYRWDRPM